MTPGMHVIRWIPRIAGKTVQVLPVGQEAYFERIEDVLRPDRTRVPLAVYTPSIGAAQTYATRDAAAHESLRYGLGEVLTLSEVLDGVCGRVLVPDDSVAGEGL